MSNLNIKGCQLQLTFTTSGDNKYTVATMEWRLVWLCVLALSVANVINIQAGHGKTLNVFCGIFRFCAAFQKVQHCCY